MVRTSSESLRCQPGRCIARHMTVTKAQAAQARRAVRRRQPGPRTSVRHQAHPVQVALPAEGQEAAAAEDQRCQLQWPAECRGPLLGARRRSKARSSALRATDQEPGAEDRRGAGRRPGRGAQPSDFRVRSRQHPVDRAQLGDAVDRVTPRRGRGEQRRVQRGPSSRGAGVSGRSRPPVESPVPATRSFPRRATQGQTIAPGAGRRTGPCRRSVGPA